MLFPNVLLHRLVLLWHIQLLGTWEALVVSNNVVACCITTPVGTAIQSLVAFLMYSLPSSLLLAWNSVQLHCIVSLKPGCRLCIYRGGDSAAFASHEVLCAPHPSDSRVCPCVLGRNSAAPSGSTFLKKGFLPLTYPTRTLGGGRGGGGPKWSQVTIGGNMNQTRGT